MIPSLLPALRWDLRMAYDEFTAKLMAENDRLRAALEAIDEELNAAAQDDCESGVKWLNERAAEWYLKEYPHTSAAISKVIDIARSALGDEND